MSSRSSSSRDFTHPSPLHRASGRRVVAYSALLLCVLLATGCESTPSKPNKGASTAAAVEATNTSSATEGEEGAGKAPESQPPSAKELEPPPTPKAGDHGVTDYDGLVRGKPRADFLEKWGKPTREMQFKMGDGIPEFRIELYNDFRPEDPKTADVQIQEDTWEVDDYLFTLWSHQKDGEWIALQAVSYSQGVDF